MNSCFETAMDAIKSLLELYVSNKDLQKAHMVAAKIMHTKQYFHIEHKAVNRYGNLSKASVSSEIISNNVPQSMKIKEDPVKSTPQTAYMSGDKDILIF